MRAVLTDIREKFIDVGAFVITELQKFPVLKGLLPSTILGSISVMDIVEGFLKILFLVLSIVGVGLTIRAKNLQIKQLKEKNALDKD